MHHEDFDNKAQFITLLFTRITLDLRFYNIHMYTIITVAIDTLY